MEFSASVLLLGSNPPHTAMNYVWSMTNAQAKLQVWFRDTQLLLKPICNQQTQTQTQTHTDTHTGLQIWKVDTILYPCGVALDSERPAPNIYTVCPLEVQTAVIASCEHRWPERAMG